MGIKFATSLTYLDISVSFLSSELSRHLNLLFKTRLGINEHKFALPHLSPSPFIVPWTCRTPALTAARVLATASSQSLCVCIPKGILILLMTFPVILSISFGKQPPLVSQSTMVSAPESCATFKTFNAYLELFLWPSKKCSASRITSLSFDLRYRTVSETIFRFSSNDTLSTSVTWKSQLLATIVTTGASVDSSAFRLGSSAAFLFARFVLPKAAILAFFSEVFLISLKKLLSLGFDKG